MMRDLPQPVNTTDEKQKGRAYSTILLNRLMLQFTLSNHLAYALVPPEIICTKTVSSLVPVYVTPFQIGSWRPFSSCVPINSRRFSFSIPVRIRILLLLFPPPATLHSELSNTPTPQHSTVLRPQLQCTAANESRGEKHAIKCNASLIKSHKPLLINATKGNPLTLPRSSISQD